MNRTALFLLVITFIVGALSQQRCDVNYGTFAGGIAFQLAQSQGFFNLFNVSVCVFPITSSVVGYQNLSNGQFDIISSATDNVYTRYFNFPAFRQNVTLLDTTSESNLQIIAGGATINTWEDFRNGTFVVDSPTSGLVILLRRALAIRNLFFERGDFNFISLGSSPQRFQYIFDGTNGTVGGVLSVPYSANLLASNNTFYQGRVKAIGLINNEILPVAGSSQQSTPQALNNATKFEYISRLIAGYLLGRRFLAQPQNREAVLNLIRSQNTTQFEPAIQLIYNQSVDPIVGEISPSLRFTEVALKNGFFLKQIFGGAPYNNTNYQPAFTPGRGRLIDYSALDAAQAKLNAFIARFNTNTSNLDVCASSRIVPGRRFTINNYVGAVVNRTTQGCTPVVQGTFLNCTSDDYSPPANCVYNARTDSLTVVIDNEPGKLNRVYNTAIAVNDLCGTTRVINRTVTVSVFVFIPPEGCAVVRN